MAFVLSIPAEEESGDNFTNLRHPAPESQVSVVSFPFVAITFVTCSPKQCRSGASAVALPPLPLKRLRTMYATTPCLRQMRALSWNLFVEFLQFFPCESLLMVRVIPCHRIVQAPDGNQPYQPHLSHTVYLPDMHSIVFRDATKLQCGTSGGSFCLLSLPASTSQSSVKSWSDVREPAVADGVLNLSSEDFTIPSPSDSNPHDSRKQGPERKVMRFSTACESDRCTIANGGRVLLRLAKSTFRADEIVGRKLVLF